ncbi:MULTISPECIES: hypothetical protein [Mesonia]|uniref:Uncharacterized protein n=1 Tax=Mesonia oceanica TaxID=2687242 RepID=A0AC61Y5R1_9FLAO|nr:MULTISPECIES: hypothetical protein [Mesonia]VVU99848.1 hypothetical protein FVB9532_01109 [Mesonia oceanica]
MDRFLCTNCGFINIDNSTCICTNCSTEIDTKSYSELMTYAGRASKYGYKYRTEYENQVAEFGEVRTQYSLLDPTTYYEWLAAAALSGMVGTVAYDLVKFVAQQIYKQITAKNTVLTESDKSILDLISDNDELIKFSNYIRQYYKGNAKIPKKALNAILKEELVHSLLDNHKGEFNETIKQINIDEDKPLDVKKEFSHLLLQASKSAGRKRKEKPKLEELKKSLKKLKKEIKKTRKEKKKRKK